MEANKGENLIKQRNLIPFSAPISKRNIFYLLANQLEIKEPNYHENNLTVAEKAAQIIFFRCIERIKERNKKMVCPIGGRWSRNRRPPRRMMGNCNFIEMSMRFKMNLTTCLHVVRKRGERNESPAKDISDRRSFNVRRAARTGMKVILIMFVQSGPKDIARIVHCLLTNETTIDSSERKRPFGHSAIKTKPLCPSASLFSCYFQQ